jgi:uncharacterized protein (TIGR02145 family)
MKYLIPILLLTSTFTIFSQDQSVPVLRIHKTDKTITTIPLKEIDSLVHATILPVDLVLLGIKNIANTSALCEARIISRGEGTLGQFGFCWSTSSNPTISANKGFSTSIDSINFSSSIYGLVKNTTYYIRAYAYNELGVSYSNQIECITLNKPDTVLETVKIGYQFWTSRNLDVSTYRNGDTIRHARSPEEWQDAASKGEGAWCYYNHDPKNGEIYGKLFNWHAVNDKRGLPPEGYHIPSNSEWSVLTDYLGGEQIGGFKMKSTTGWENNANGDNSSGFNGMPGGTCEYDGKFYYCSQEGFFWSTREGAPGLAHGRYLHNNYGWVHGFVYEKGGGCSVRCIRD